MNITMDNVVEAHQKCIADIAAYDYYAHIYRKLSEAVDPVTITDPAAICGFWNDFWCALPDHMAIHRNPFDLICDIAEGSYLDEDIEEDNL